MTEQISYIGQVRMSYRWRDFRRLRFVLFAIVAAYGARVSGQGVQAIRGVADETTVPRTTISKDSVLIAVSARAAQFRTVLKAATAQRNTNAFSAISRAEKAANEVLRDRDHPQAFSDAISTFNRAEQEIASLQLLDSSQYEVLTSIGEQPFGPLNTPVPAVHALIPDVVFVLGFDVTSLPSDADNGWVAAVGVTTNLLGAAVGTAFDALGSNGLKDYFTNNISAGTAVPTSGPHKLSAQLGLGLGGLTLGRFTVWPAINIEQRDTADARVPRKVVALNSAQSNWSTPGFGVAIPLAGTDAIVRRIQSGRPFPILTLGYLLPYYFPGDNFTALGALFSSKRGEYERSGGGRISVGVSMPLMKVKASESSSKSKQ